MCRLLSLSILVASSTLYSTSIGNDGCPPDTQKVNATTLYHGYQGSSGALASHDLQYPTFCIIVLEFVVYE